MADKLSDEELELIERHRAEKAAKAGRTVRVRGKHGDSEYEFDLDGDEAEKVRARHSALWADDDDGQDDDDDGKAAKGKPAEVRRFGGRRVS